MLKDTFKPLPKGSGFFIIRYANDGLKVPKKIMAATKIS